MKLDIDNLSKSFNSHRIISNVNLSIEDCRALVFIGPSGSGKSTLLRLIAGLEYPDEGSIVFDGKPIRFDDETALRQFRKSCGTVFQTWNLFPHLTALENIVLPLYRVHGISKDEAEMRGINLLTRFGLKNDANKRPFELSGGQSQRVALIRAVAVQPKMLLLDEPTSALDPLMTAEVLDLITELKREGQQLILVTHHVQFAKSIADTVVFLADGKILEHGSFEEITYSPQSSLTKEYMSKVLSY